MGGCRMLNVLLGMSVLASPLGGQHFLVAGALGVYICGVTWLARGEADRSDRRQLAAATLLMAAGIGMLALLPRRGENFVSLLRDDPGRWHLLLAMLVVMICWRCVAAIIKPTAKQVQSAVANAILWIIVIDAVACLAARGQFWALMFLLLLVPAMLLGQLIRST